MSRVKFGDSDKNTSNQPITRKYGKKADGVSFWKFGEPVEFYQLKKLLDYLPQFVKQNALCISIMTSIAIEIEVWRAELKTLLTMFFKGKTGLKYANSDLQLFLSTKSTDLEIQQSVRNYFKIHKERGTVPGIVKDLKRLVRDPGAIVKFFPFDKVGWWFDETFPEYDDDGRHNLINTNVYYDLDNMVELIFCNNSGFSDKEVQRIIRDEFIPVVINIRIIITKPHTVKWGEPDSFYNPNYLKFGLFKFGEQIGGCQN